MVEVFPPPEGSVSPLSVEVVVSPLSPDGVVGSVVSSLEEVVPLSPDGVVEAVVSPLEDAVTDVVPVELVVPEEPDGVVGAGFVVGLVVGALLTGFWVVELPPLEGLVVTLLLLVVFSSPSSEICGADGWVCWVVWVDCVGFALTPDGVIWKLPS